MEFKVIINMCKCFKKFEGAIVVQQFPLRLKSSIFEGKFFKMQMLIRR